MLVDCAFRLTPRCSIVPGKFNTITKQIIELPGLINPDEIPPHHYLNPAEILQKTDEFYIRRLNAFMSKTSELCLCLPVTDKIVDCHKWDGTCVEFISFETKNVGFWTSNNLMNIPPDTTEVGIEIPTYVQLRYLTAHVSFIVKANNKLFTTRGVFDIPPQYQSKIVYKKPDASLFKKYRDILDVIGFVYTRTGYLLLREVGDNQLRFEEVIESGT